MFGRWAEPLWKRKLAAPYVHLVFGARQTGKSTLLRKVLPETAIWLDFSRPAERAEYLRSKAGAEVDFIIARGGRPIPIEVKWTEHPTPGDARHLLTFLDEHPKRARHGYVICRCPTPLALTDRVTALPWSHL